MPGGPRRIVTIGGSAGSIEVLKTIVAGLKAELPAAVLVVVHILPSSESRLPKLLAGRSRLPVRHAANGEPIAEGTVLVAPPDHHLLVNGDDVALSHGPMENSSRPSIDVLFRSAAQTSGVALCGVILSGTLDDGADGLRRMVDAGGVAIVQDPEDAQQRDMPVNAIASCPTSRVLPGDMIAAAINEWADDGPTGGGALAKGRSDVVADEPGDGISLVGESLRPTGLTCPECRGVLWTSDGAGEPHFRCRVGHRFTFETLRHLQRTEVERSMWAAVRALEEEASLCRQIATRAESNGRLGLAMRFGRRHDSTLRHADTLRDLLHHFGDPAPVSGRES